MGRSLGLRGQAHGMNDIDTTRITMIIATDSKRQCDSSANETGFEADLLSHGGECRVWCLIISHWSWLDIESSLPFPFLFARSFSIQLHPTRCMISLSIVYSPLLLALYLVRYYMYRLSQVSLFRGTKPGQSSRETGEFFIGGFWGSLLSQCSFSFLYGDCLGFNVEWPSVVIFRSLA